MTVEKQSMSLTANSVQTAPTGLDIAVLISTSANLNAHADTSTSDGKEMNMSRNEPLPQLRYPLIDVAKILHLSRATLYERINSGRLVIHKDGRRTFVTSDEIRRYIASSQ
jgi:hypothetical protein